MAKEYKAKAEHGEHAHFHGDEICTTNHGELPDGAPILKLKNVYIM